ncbi:unnamed protein product [Brassica oleracea var. botrytis]|uniref:(rape) hypothetical protein n=1 Tax=Brassica napus TaxID=3708 RepID=A0A816UPX9_BRANA|nr:unnamed protein product [Brassica napus]
MPPEFNPYVSPSPAPKNDISKIRHEFDLAKQRFLNTSKALINMPKMQSSRFAID